MSQGHAKLIEEGIATSMRRAGISPIYHEQSLADFKHPDAERIRQWVTTTARTKPGKGFTFIGGADMEDFAILTAKGLHLSRQMARVFNLTRFVELLSTDRDSLEDRISSARTLLITQAGPWTIGEKAFTDHELRMVVWRLEDWMGEDRRLLLHANLPLARAWYPPSFLQRVAQCNEVIGERR